ncbi:MAG: hypothetical protein JSS91_00855 [Bacteroidetes bacterium]|nr:hypothetical protein [Bacteroidota bacterium]
MGAYLDFSAISKQITFEQLLNWLNIPFTDKGTELIGKNFVVNVEKNLYLNTSDKEQRGSIINYLSHHKQIDLRAAALEIKHQFLVDKSKEEKKIPDLELHYTDQLLSYGITKEIAEQYQIGLVKQKSIMAGKIALKVYNEDNSVAGYIGYSVKDGWYFPKNFKRPIWNLNRLFNEDFIFLVANPFDALKLITLGYSHTACLLGNSMTDDQLKQLQSMPNLQCIHLIHTEPMNIVSRVAKHLFIRYDIPPKPIRELDHTEFQQFFLHSPP